MRSASNFHPEWGYLAPAPSFMRTARIVLVATAVGATAGAGVVLSLVDRPAGENAKTASAAHAIVTSVEAAPASVPSAAIAPPVAPANVMTAAPTLLAQGAAVRQAVAAPLPATAAPQPGAVENLSAPATLAAPPAQPAPGVASLSDVPAAAEVEHADGREDAILPPETVPPDKKPKHRVANSYAPAAQPIGLGTMLRRLFHASTSSTQSRSYYPGYWVR